MNRLNFTCVCLFFALVFVFQTSLADETSFQVALERLKIIEDHLPDDDDFFRLLEDDSLQLSRVEQDNLFGMILRLQKGDISRGDVHRIFEARRNSILDAKICYSVSADVLLNHSSVSRGNSLQHFTFAFSDHNTYLKRDGKRMPEDYRTSVMSTDGIVLIDVALPDNDIPNASITQVTSPDYYRYFYQINMPLFSACLLDENRYGYAFPFGDDIVQFLSRKGFAHVFKQEKTINGIRCLVVLNEMCRFYLAIEKDLSPVRYELFSLRMKADLNPSSSIERFAGRSLIFRRDFSNFVDCGNGIWIPLVIEDTRFSEDNRTDVVRVNVKDVQINKGIPDAFFTDVIPDDAMVADGIRGLVYRQGDHASIEGLLKETVKSKRVFIFQYISVTIGILLILIWITVKYLAYRKRKKAE